MALKKIPLTSDFPNYEIRIELDGVVFNMAFRYNTREGRWFMDIKDASDVMLVAGIKLILGVQLIERFQDIRLPFGSLFMINEDNSTEEPGRSNLGINALMLYEEAL